MELTRRMFSLGALAGMALAPRPKDPWPVPPAGEAFKPPFSFRINDVCLESPTHFLVDGVVRGPGWANTHVHSGQGADGWEWSFGWTSFAEPAPAAQRLALAMAHARLGHVGAYEGFDARWLRRDGLLRASWSWRPFRLWTPGKTAREEQFLVLAGERDLYQLVTSAPVGHRMARKLRESVRLAPRPSRAVA